MTEQSWGRVRDCMKTNVTEVDGRMDVLSAMRVMKKVGATSLIVKRRDEGDEFGLLLFSDIAKKVIGRNRAPERVNVYEIMAKPVVGVDPDMDIRYCSRLMSSLKLTRILVVRDNELLGRVSPRALVLDGLAALEEDA